MTMASGLASRSFSLVSPKVGKKHVLPSSIWDLVFSAYKIIYFTNCEILGVINALCINLDKNLNQILIWYQVFIFYLRDKLGYL
ncbi:MAG TPA: hypothetical protein PLN99_03250, partial [Daejeonella sp.]|nr:hypothetical protein [Daejeonella sp.]